MERVCKYGLDKDFCFLVNGQEYWCNKAEAVFVSLGVGRLLDHDATTREMILDVDGIGNAFDHVFDLMRGKVVCESNIE